MTQTYMHPGTDLQAPFDVAVIIPSVLSPSLKRALDSVFKQSFSGRIQVVIGIDKPLGDLGSIEEACKSRPENCVVTLLDMGYSTSVRHGGLCPARDGGVLRTALSYLANSRYLAYLDDDNWWHEDHIANLYEAIQGMGWSFSLRWYVDPENFTPLCVDKWESVGPDAGVFAEKAGGFVDPNSLMIDKLTCESVLRWWSIPLPGDQKAMSADRHVFAVLRKNYSYQATGKATSYYVIDPTDAMHSLRQQWISRKTS